MREPLRKSDKTFTLRLTQEESEAVEIMATVMRLSKNSFIRGCIHTACYLVYDMRDGYRPAAKDLLEKNRDLFNAIDYDRIDILNEHFEGIK